MSHFLGLKFLVRPMRHLGIGPDIRNSQASLPAFPLSWGNTCETQTFSYVRLRV